jgi:cytochrome c553
MEVIGFALRIAILAIVFSAASHAEDAAAPSKQDVEGKAQYCKDCHGASGEGFRGYYPIPRLAGQTTEYFENQLRAFAEHRRENDISIVMSRVHGLADASPAMRTALATYFSGLNPEPVEGGPENLVAMGRKIFFEGVPETNIPACAACHGPEAKGHEIIPRLAGQLYPYVTKELAEWSTARGQDPAVKDTSRIMAPIAHSLTQPQISAVAAYISNLK